MRRSREDSLKTRRSIVLAARRVFARRGVSQSSMEQIASAAGVTRGAIYGHFRDKQDLFQCMREQVRLPLLDAMDELLLDTPGDPLAGVQHYLEAVFGAMRDDAATRDTFHILLFKCEYVGDMGQDITNQVRRNEEIAARLEGAFRSARKLGQLRTGLTPHLAALQTLAFLAGLVRLWLLDESGTLVRKDAAKLVRGHVASLRT